MSALNDKPDSQNDVVTTVAHLLFEFEQAVRAEMPQVGCVFDADFSYETGLAKYIEKSTYNEAKNQTKELFIYNRTITEDSTFGMGSRTKNQIGTIKTDSGEILKYSCAYSEYDLNFMYVSHSMELLEKFEVAYNANVGISAIRELTVRMGDIGDFKYYLTPLPLTEVSLPSDGGVTYKAIMGIFRVRGYFFVFSGSEKAISEINSVIGNIRAGKIYSTNDMVTKEPRELLADLEVKINE